MARFAKLLLIGMLLSPLPALASGKDARREYIARNYDAALRISQDHAARGDSTAMLVIGMIYYAGKGTAQNYETALKWWKAAAILGNSRAQNNVGYIYLKGLGVEKDYNEAAKWINLAARQNEAYAYSNLGLMYSEGYGVVMDFAKSIEFYKKAEVLFWKELRNDPENHEAITATLNSISRQIAKLTSLAKSVPRPPEAATVQQTTPQ